MSFLSQFFKLSQMLRNIHNQLLEDVGLPVWGSYLIFAAATVVLGTILGLLVVCLIDFFFPQKPAQQQGKKKQTSATDSPIQEKNSDEDEIAENIGDDLIDEEESETEEPETKESEAKESETKESEMNEVETSEKDKDSKADTSSPNIRKRKPRKAD
ncbi:Thioredoxin-related transmembrane protein 1 [Acromyrmex echinatior]|uniref:Thioredoxin-related transmembrane protein 1 n=2 Tax=Acromyrmex TaxID=64782 RepID=F4W615_ACREC|nr:Thioredoxin-related transmembrane protein 1 [Acromyrmex echinatior]